MQGLKNVRTRRTDALTQVGWDQLESLLAVYYRGQGYTVDKKRCGLRKGVRDNFPRTRASVARVSEAHPGP